MWQKVPIGKRICKETVKLRMQARGIVIRDAYLDESNLQVLLVSPFEVL
jgi:hypothetical protein